MAIRSKPFAKGSRFYRQSRPPWISSTCSWDGAKPKPSSSFFPAPNPSEPCKQSLQRCLTAALWKHPTDLLIFPLKLRLACEQPARKKGKKKKGKEVIPPRFATVIPPSEVDVDGVGMNRWRVVIRLASKPAASSPSCPGVAGTAHRRRARPDAVRLSTAVARRRR